MKYPTTFPFDPYFFTYISIVLIGSQLVLCDMEKNALILSY